MESDWEEKRIQALFSEVRGVDEQVAPRFATVWNRAQISPRRLRAFNPAFVAATALLVCALISLAVWSKYSQPTRPAVAVNGVSPSIDHAPRVAVPVETVTGPVEVSPAQTPRIIKRPRTAKLSAQQSALVAANRRLTRDAKAITSWKSPTADLLSSSSDEIFTSLPQLNQSASDLKSFLPNQK